MRALGSPAIPVYQPNAQGMGSQIMDVPTNIVRTFEQPIWSTWQYAQGTALTQRNDVLFAVAEGATGQGFGANPLGHAETNMTVGGQFPAGLSMAVYSIALDAYYPLCEQTTRRDLFNIDAHLVLQWVFLQTRIDIALANLIGQGGGIFGSTADTGAADGTLGAREIFNRGAGQVWTYRIQGVMLQSKLTFGIALVWGLYAMAVDGTVNSITYAMNMRAKMLGQVNTAVGQG